MILVVCVCVVWGLEIDDIGGATAGWLFEFGVTFFSDLFWKEERKWQAQRMIGWRALCFPMALLSSRWTAPRPLMLWMQVGPSFPVLSCVNSTLFGANIVEKFYEIHGLLSTVSNHAHSGWSTWNWKYVNCSVDGLFDLDWCLEKFLNCLQGLCTQQNASSYFLAVRGLLLGLDFSSPLLKHEWCTPFEQIWPRCTRSTSMSGRTTAMCG